MLQNFLKVNSEVIVHSQLCGELIFENFDSLSERVGSSKRHMRTKNSQINSLESLACTLKTNSQKQPSIVVEHSQQQYSRVVGTYAPTQFSKANSQKSNSLQLLNSQNQLLLFSTLVRESLLGICFPEFFWCNSLQFSTVVVFSKSTF